MQSALPVFEPRLHGEVGPRIPPTSSYVLSFLSLNPSSFVLRPFYIMSKPVDQPRKTAVATPSAQQGDNIAHALAGAGGGLLSMTLTSVPTLTPLSQLIN